MTSSPIIVGCFIVLIIVLIALLPITAFAQAREPDFIHFDADLLCVTFDNKVVATGNVKAVYREYTITSGEAVSDPNTNTATFEENVVLSSSGLELHGERMTLNLKTHEWELKTAKTTITPEVLKGNIRSPIFASGVRLTGTETNQVNIHDSKVTTCDLPEPHYALSAKEIDIYPESKIIAKTVTLLALGHRLFTLPALSIPLNKLNSRSNIIPQIGQTAAEGMFVKTAYNYLATKNTSGMLKLDLMSRKGFGQGLEQTYTLGKAAGSITTYHLTDRTLGVDSYTGRLTHRQQFGNVLANLTSDYRSNTYQFAPTSTSRNTDLSLIRNVEGANTQLRIRGSITDAFNSFQTLTSVLTHRQKLFGADSILTLDYGLFGNSSQPADNRELNSRLEMSRRLEHYDWQMVLTKRYDLDGDEFLGDERFASLDRLPELTLQTDTTRLGRKLLFGLPAAMSLSVGKYDEEPLGVETERLAFDINTQPLQYAITSGLGLTVRAGFRQAFYGNEAAQYVIRLNTDLKQKIGEKSSFGLGYRYQEPKGASAFRFDFASTYNVLTARLNVRESPKLNLSLSSGYNFALPRLPWQDITLRMRYTPVKSFSIYTSTGYDINRSQWRGLINQLQVRSQNGFKLDVGTRYDIERHNLGTARAVLDTPLGGKIRIQGIAGYDGFNQRFTYRAIQVTRDLHCWEVSLAYVDQSDFYVDRGIRLNIRIKAFPVFDQFGIGQRGQSLMDTSLGEVF